MKKILLLPTFFWLIGCANTIEQYADKKGSLLGIPNTESIAKDLEQRKDPLATLTAFRYMEDGYIHSYDNSRGLSSSPFVQDNITPECWMKFWDSGNYANTDDKCILERRNNSNHKKLEEFFDFKRFLPDNTWIKTYEDFEILDNFYTNLLTRSVYASEKYPDVCDEIWEPVNDLWRNLKSHKENTKEEKEAYSERYFQAKKECFYRIATTESARDEIDPDKIKERKRQQERQKEEQKQKERNKTYSAYEQCIKRANLCTDKYNKGCRRGFGYWYSSDQGVTYMVGTPWVHDIVRNGVIVKYKEEYLFLYTDKKYVNNEYISDDTYYEYVGPYEYKTTEGALRRIDAFKETDIPICKDPRA